MEVESSAARFFESNTNIGSTGVNESDDSKLQNLDVIRKILATFSLDETKQKYETQDVVEYVLDPNDFGYDCSLSTTRVRQRLCDLMGTDVIRLNDKRYFQKLSEKLQDEYETVMDKQEDARAASEHERIRRLMLEGVIDAPNDHRAIVYGDHNKRHGKKKRKKGKRQSSASGHSSATQSRLSDDEGIYKSRKEEVETQVGLQSSSRPSSTKSSLRGRTPDSRSQGKRVNIEEKENEVYSTSNELHARPPHHENALRSPDPTSDMKRGSRRVKSAAPRINRWEKDSVSSDHTDDDVTSQDGFDTQSLPDATSMRKGSKFSRQEPERVSKLRTEETVAGLYSIAEEIVSPVRAEDQKYERKGKKAY
ncbi:uncharacterized protein LOC128224001 isoform X2 [Mya arenaria]|uniref:uncharacterized protein LOC128224001 isoform X2 n=1 Tax=Mya arenaria TaxID=6604 RepID=UPI0022E49B64|nr:uncharacterized protein LOC128224001 isoform X2 [Mya arenaria]